MSKFFPPNNMTKSEGFVPVISIIKTTTNLWIGPGFGYGFVPTKTIYSSFSLVYPCDKNGSELMVFSVQKPDKIESETTGFVTSFSYCKIQ